MNKNWGVMVTGHIYSKPETSIFTYRLINQSIDLSTDGRNGWRYKSVGQQTSGRITWLVYQRRRGEPYQRTQSDGRALCLFQIPDINIHLSIDVKTQGRQRVGVPLCSGCNGSRDATPHYAYIKRQQTTIVERLARRPIYELCTETYQMPWMSRLVHWWDQDEVNEFEEYTRMRCNYHNRVWSVP